MLSKKQKFIMIVLGILGLFAGIAAAIPFRSFPGLNKLEDVLAIEAIVKAGLGVFAILLAVYPLVKKYQLVKNFREQSKVVLQMTYLPALFYMIGVVVNLVYVLSFDYTAGLAQSALSEKFIGIAIALLVVYLVFLMYAIFRIHALTIKLDTLGHTLFDVLALVILGCFVFIQYHLNSVYHESYQTLEAYYQGNPLLFVVYILLVAALYLGLKYVVRVVRKDEVLVYFVDEAGQLDRIRQVEFNRAYNDTLDDYEAFFDESVEKYTDMKIEALEEFKQEEVEEVCVELEEVEEEDNTPVVELSLEEIQNTNSEEVIALEKEKEAVAAEIEKSKEALAAVLANRNELEEKENALKVETASYEQEFAAYNQSKLDSLAEAAEPAPAAKKVKKIVPSFEKMVEYANSFSEKEGFKVVSNAKGNLHKFYIGKKMCLVMQSTNNDYRINFITTSDKFVNYLKSRPGELTAPKNLKDNYWVRLVNKGKEEAKFMRQVIKQAFQAAEKQLADEAAAKAAAKKAKQEEKAKERAAARAAAKAANKE